MSQHHHRRALARTTIALACALCAHPSATSAEIDTGNADLSIRFDNTVKYNYARRLNEQHLGILKNANFDDGNRNFARGTVSNRFDLLSEFDLVYQKRFGLRVSGAAWNDAAYGELDNKNVATSNHQQGGANAIGLSGYTRRFHQRGGELLDAFVFYNMLVGDGALNVKLGRHTQVWGESLLTPVHGLNYGQSSLDLIKAYTVPGTEAKELFLPRQAASMNWAPNDELSIAAQYFFKWSPARLPESGSFLGFYDYGFQGSESFNLGPLGKAIKLADSAPKQRGDFGVAMRWSPAFLDGTLGAFVRRTGDVLPQANLRLAGLPLAMLGGAGGAAAGANVCKGLIPGSAVAGNICLFYPATLGATSKYQLEYGGDIDVFGLSLSKSVAGMSVGAELSYRRNMPLASSPVLLMPAGTGAPVVAALNNAFGATTPLVVTAAGLPASGSVSGAYGNTLHGVVNVFGITPKTALFDAATWIAELTWNRTASVTRGVAFYKGRASYTGVDKVDGDYFGLAINVNPTWYQVFPGVDLSMPLSGSVGLKGNSPIVVGGNARAGNYSVGLSFDLYQRYKFDIKYSDFFGPLGYDANGAAFSNAGVSPLLKDRGFIAIAFKTSF